MKLVICVNAVPNTRIQMVRSYRFNHARNGIPSFKKE